MPREKVVMGLGTYGRTFALVDASQTGVGAAGKGPGEAGKYTREPGFMSYYEICEKLKSGKWTSRFDDEQKSMYAFGEGMWVGYDDATTIAIRVSEPLEKNRSQTSSCDHLGELHRTERSRRCDVLGS